MEVTATVFLIFVMATRAPVNSGIQLRLVSSSNNYYSSGGRLEIYYRYAWRPFCSNYFNNHEANLACKKLGYFQASNYGRVGELGYSQSSGLYSSVRTYCYSYTTFDSCTNYITSTCTRYYDVAINCVHYRSTTYSQYYVTSSPANVNSLRLVSSTTNYRSSGGRLEIYYYYNGRYAWRPFCSTYFSSHEANLACQKLGYSHASIYGRVGSLGYFQGTGTYSIQTNCYSTSTTFDSCTKYITSTCSHYNDVAINCSSLGSTIGLITGLVVSFVLIFVCCGGIIVCSVVIAYVYHKKKSTGVRAVNVVPTHPVPDTTTHMVSHTQTRAAQGNTAVPDAAPPYTQTPFTSTMQQQQDYYPQKGHNNPDACPAYGEEIKGSF